MNLKIPKLKQSISLFEFSGFLQLRESGFHVSYQGNRNIQLMVSRQNPIDFEFPYLFYGLKE